MKTLEQLQRLIADEVDAYCKDNGHTSIYEPINYLMQLGGKRLRPALTLMTANLFIDDLTDVIHPALAIEVFHNFTLMHDDIMDNAPLRRGKPTVHEKWNRDVAILSGDAMMIQSYQLMMKTRPELLNGILNIFNQTALEVCVGQQMDMDFENLQHVSIDQYLEMIRLKTSVLLAGAMKIGALIGGADAQTQKYIYDFGIQMGLSFQLWDDYLDAFGTTENTGKQKGGDIIAGKKTYLLLSALEKANGKELETLNQQSVLVENKVKSVLEVYKSLGVDIELKAYVERLHSNGMQILEKIPVSEERKKMLRNFALSLKDRKS